MKKFAKRILALSVCSALVGGSVNAATYQVIDKGAVDTHKYSFAQQENNSGEMVISGTQAYSFSVQYQYLDEDDFDDIVALADANHEIVIDIENIEDEAALRAGNPTQNDSFWAVNYLKGKSNNLSYQKYGDVAALINLNSTTEEITIFDTTFAGTDELTRSTVDNVNGITDKGWIYGSASAPYLPVEITNDQDTTDTSDDTTSNYWVREFITRGFYSLDRGQTILPLIAPESTYGGMSEISDISEDGIAVGYASISIAEEVDEYIQDNCTTEEQLEDTPLIVCIDVVLRNNGLTLNDIYSIEAYKWSINDSGEIEQADQLGYLITPHVDDERGLVSVAQAINDSGTIVGYSAGWVDDDVTTPDENEAKSTYAVVFKDDRVVQIHDQHDTYYRSRANDINNQGIAVGHVETTIGGSARNQFYYADVNNLDNIEMVMPDGFFNGSSASAKSINENGLIVGVGEVETNITTDGSSRRTHGFIYDIAADTFTDLNSYLPCDSDYTIIDAKSINEENEISATALVRINAKDFFGEDLVDDNGDPVTEEVVRAVKLEPIAGEIEDCSVEEEKSERQGASFGLFMPLVLLVIGFRRKFRL